MGIDLDFLSILKPSEKAVQSFLEKASKSCYNHDHVKGTQNAPELPSTMVGQGWIVDHNRIQVGKGKRTYLRAKQAVQNWDHFRLGWAEVNEPPVKVGAKVCVVAKCLLLWVLNPLEIVYVREGSTNLPAPSIPGNTSIPRNVKAQEYSFAHTTLKGHLLKGEERFAVEWHKRDDSVWFDIFTFSKADTPLALAAYPVRRWYQKRFAKDSMAALVKAAAG